MSLVLNSFKCNIQNSKPKHDFKDFGSVYHDKIASDPVTSSQRGKNKTIYL